MCGDASWGTATLAMVSEACEHIDLQIVLRDSHPQLIKHYNTGGSESIPKLVCYKKKDLTELGTWGPRPQALQAIVTNTLQGGQFDYKESVRKIHEWYRTDMTRSTQEELCDLIKEWKTL